MVRPTKIAPWIRLTTLGRIDLIGRGGARLQSVLAQPKRLALLAYLAVEGEGASVRRDTLLALFWPEAGASEARNNLKQSLYHLRRSVGVAALPKEGADAVRVDPAVVRCDAVAFTEACRTGCWADAFELYQGDLLPGLHGDLSREFESWMDAHRFRLRTLAAEASLRLAEQFLEPGGDSAAAANAVGRVIDLACHNEAMVRKGLRLLANAGNGAAVAELYATFERRLADELDVEPDPETRGLVEELLRSRPPMAQRAGPRLAAADAEGHEPCRPIAAPVGGAGPRRPAAWSRALRVAGAALFLMVLGVYLVARSDGRSSIAWPGNFTDAEVVPRFVVRPFEASDDPTAAAVARLLPPLVRNHLAASDGIAVHAADADGPGMADGGFHVLRVDGLVRETSGGIVLDLGVADSFAGRVVATRSFRHQARDWAAVEDLSREAADWLRSVVGREITAREQLIGAREPAAARLVELADEARWKARAHRAEGRLEVATRGFAEADSLLELAETIDPTWVEPIVARGRIAGEFAWLAVFAVPPNRARVRSEFQRAIDIATRAVTHSPDHAGALETRGLMWDRLRALAELDELEAASAIAAARSDLERAVALDRRRVRAWSALSQMAYREGDHAGALWRAQTAYDLDRYLDNAREVLFLLFATSHEVGDDDAAEQWCGEIVRRYPDESLAFYCQLARLAWNRSPDPADVDVAWALLESAAGAPFLSLDGPRFELLVASIIAAAPMPDSAEAVVARAAARGRSDPELLHFEALVRMRLGQADSARALLERFASGKPSGQAQVIQRRRFEPLRNQPE